MVFIESGELENLRDFQFLVKNGANSPKTLKLCDPICIFYV